MLLLTVAPCLSARESSVGAAGCARATPAPRISFVIPAYNEEMVIVRTIRSVLQSDYSNIRVIVIDDGAAGAADAGQRRIGRSALARDVPAGGGIVRRGRQRVQTKDK